MWRILFVIVGLVLIPPSLQAEQPSESQLQDWVKQLGSSQYTERQKAERELASVGVAAQHALTSARDSIDPEQRMRVLSLLERIQHLQISEPSQSGRKLTLQYKNQPLTVVVEELKKLTQLPLILSQEKVANKSRLITLERKDVPLWQVVELLCEAANLHEEFRADVHLPAQKPNGTTSYFSNGQGMVFTSSGMISQIPTPLPSQVPLILADGKRTQAPGIRDGRVRVIAMEGDFPANKILRGVGQVLLSLDVAPDPQLNWQEVTHVRITRAEDANGRPVFPNLIPAGDFNPTPENVFWGGQIAVARRQMMIHENTDAPNGNGVSVANPRLTQVSLRTEDRDIRMLRRLEGVVIGEIHQPNTPITTIDNIFQNQGNTHNYVDQSTLTIQSTTVSADGETAVRIRMETLQPWIQQQMQMGRRGGVVFGARIEFEQNIGNMLGKIQFYRADGKLCKTPMQTSTRYMGDNLRQSLETELRFPKSDKPLKLVRIGTKISPLEVPFKLENVRMP